MCLSILWAMHHGSHCGSPPKLKEEIAESGVHMRFSGEKELAISRKLLENYLEVRSAICAI